ncbi:MAG: DUF1992 domain-containing protein [Rhodobacteraceae bacterium]|nr:DUF1992 domain-containing protein [Paracoccaceae bacterium]
MARDLRTLIEQRIAAAVAKGELTGLAGEGAPLPERPGDALVDAGEAVAYRMMAEAGALPEEFRLKAQADAARQAVQDAPEAERKAAMAKLAELEMRHAIAREARQKFMR